ncbi:MAG: hypothetical protein U0975_03270 [Erythrobacter sp.]|nr:hypothetical protein [Erythrobacter sp.]
MNDNVVEPQDSWKHNGFGVANNPQVLWGIAQEGAVELSGSKLYFYCAYEHELESDGWTFDSDLWRPISPAASAGVSNEVIVPNGSESGTLLGYDVVVFGDYLEHSPLSCNSIASELPVNRYCLFDDLEEAKEAIENGKFGGGCEDGVYKIFSVSLIRGTDP